MENEPESLKSQNWREMEESYTGLLAIPFRKRSDRKNMMGK